MFTVFEDTKAITEEVKKIRDKLGSDVLVATVTTDAFTHTNNKKTPISIKEMKKAKKVIIIITEPALEKTVKQIISYHEYDKNKPLSLLYDKDVKYKTEVFLTKDLIGDGCGGNCNCGNGGCC